MEHDFLGYLLGALDRQEHEQVEAYLRGDPDAQRQLAVVRQTLAPLALDRAIEPPTGLAARTLARLPQAAVAPYTTLESPRVTRFALPGRRLIEFAVAAACILTLVGLGALWVARIRGVRPDDVGAVQMVECKNNLQKLFVPLRAYADTHRGEFPNVAAADTSPRNVVALVFPMLKDAKVLPADATIACPMASCTPCLNDLMQVKALDLASLQNWASSMVHTYAYSLGHRSQDKLVGLRLDEGQATSLMPLMADSPPADLSYGNSPDHSGRGQNVLYADGHITFCASRHVGYEQDDIYLNRRNQVAAGIDWRDTVLACGPAIP
jgi:prepilin-type processing-associated H-X9-DG protein